MQTRSQARNLALNAFQKFMDAVNDMETPPHMRTFIPNSSSVMIERGMRTRSQTKHPEFAVEIDFDEASNLWLKNKIKLGTGCYAYK